MARNVGLDAARGELVAYLDDDNLMGPLWTKAVVWAAGRAPDVQLFYGAELVDGPIERGRAGWRPEPTPTCRSTVVVFSVATTRSGVIAPRTLAEAHRHPPRRRRLGLPDAVLTSPILQDPGDRAVATAVRALPDHRESGSGRDLEGRARTCARQRPLRVLAYNKMYPVDLRGYIGESRRLPPNGAIRRCSYDQLSPSPSPDPLPRT